MTKLDETKTQNILSTNKNAPKDAAPPSPALDVVVLLDVSDEQVLERATPQPPEGTQIGTVSVRYYSIIITYSYTSS